MSHGATELRSHEVTVGRSDLSGQYLTSYNSQLKLGQE